MNEAPVTSGRRKLLAVYLLAGMALFSSISSLQGSLLGNIIRTYTLSAASQGLPTSAAFAGGVAALAATFFLSGRLPKWGSLLAAFSVCAASLLALTLRMPFAAFIGLWAVLGFGMGLLDTLLSACLAQLYEGRSAVLMMCLLHAMYGISGTAVPVLYRSLLDGGFRWNAVYFLPCALALFLIAAGTVLKTRQCDAASQGYSGGNIFRTIRENRLYFWIAAMFFHGFFLSGLNTWINRFAETARTPVSFMPPMSFMFFGILLSRLAMSFLPVRTDLYVKTAGFLAAAALFAGAFLPSFLNVCLMISGLFFGALIPIMLTIACSRLQENTLAATTALILALYLGEALSSPIIGAIEGAVSLRAGIAACGVCMILCSLCCMGQK